MDAHKKLLPLIRAIPDFPEPGIVFRDITPLLKDYDVLSFAIEALVAPFRDLGIGSVAGMEARGFIFGALAARALGVGFVPLRKPGKLPFSTNRVDYELEYGEASLEVHTDAVNEGEGVLLVDDVIATGGTARASCELLRGQGAHIVGCAFLIELTALNGRAGLSPRVVHSVITY
ncbi:MAG: adenine phosphoribosyltransferase [Gammaproteobacteria bacterium]|jgi:adenine phosphoribosyltransferase